MRPPVGVTPATSHGLADVHWTRPSVSWLIHAKLSTARKRQLSEQTPTLVLYRFASDIVRCHRRDKQLDVVAHQVKLMHIVRIGRMHGDLGRWEAEDQPAAADIDARQFEHVP